MRFAGKISKVKTLPLIAVCVFSFALNVHAAGRKTGGGMVITDDLSTGFAASVGLVGGASRLLGAIGQVSALESSGGAAVLRGGYFSRAVRNPDGFNYTQVNVTSMTVSWSGPALANPVGTIYDFA